MFKKIIQFCTFTKKEKIMSTDTKDTRTTRELKKKVANQGETISHLKDRVSDLRDEVAFLKSELQSFQKKVQSDMTSVFETMKRS